MQFHRRKTRERIDSELLIQVRLQINKYQVYITNISAPHVHTIVCLLVLPFLHAVEHHHLPPGSPVEDDLLVALVVSWIPDLALLWGLVLPQARLSGLSSTRIFLGSCWFGKMAGTDLKLLFQV